jgi:hypothetical protein
MVYPLQALSFVSLTALKNIHVAMAMLPEKRDRLYFYALSGIKITSA